jgi:hypothetical protein
MNYFGKPIGLKWLLRCVVIVSVLSPLAQAREMQGRLGIGYNNEFANQQNYTNGVPAVSFKYGLTRDIAAELAIGLNTSSPTNSVTAIKFFKNIFYETNLNFYFMLGAGILSAQPAGATSNNTGAEFLGGLGAEFFIPGIESLGFAMETGGEIDNLSGTFGLRTIGFSFLNAGIHFYF